MKIADFKFNYFIRGRVDRPWLLLLHGFLGASNDWEELSAALSDRYRCLAVDLPGHGKTYVLGAEDCYTMEKTAHALFLLLDRLGIQRCFLAGYSMGGRLALYLALTYPDRFAKVLLASASPGLKSAQERMNRLETDLSLAYRLETGDYAHFVDQWYNQPLFQTLRQHPHFNRLRARRFQHNPASLAKSLRKMGPGAQPSLWGQLPQNSIPLLLLAGEHDAKFRGIAAEVTALCPTASATVIPASGHTVQFENQSAFIQALQAFLT